MKVVGVTGGIGSGKTVVCRIFSALGVPVYDSDARAKELMESDERIRKQLTDLFGTDAYTSGKLNRAAISKTVFSDPSQLEKLNAIVHPAVANDFSNWTGRQQTQGFVIKEAAILFESGASKQTDTVISVIAPEEIRIQRVLKRDNRNEEQVRNIIRKQMSDKERIRRSDHIIVNDGNEMVLPQVLSLYDELMSPGKHNPSHHNR